MTKTYVLHWFDTSGEPLETTLRRVVAPFEEKYGKRPDMALAPGQHDVGTIPGIKIISDPYLREGEIKLMRNA